MSEYNDPNQESPYAAQTTTKGQTQAAFDPSQVASSGALNYAGIPTEYYDKNGALIGYLGNNNQVMSTSGMNFVNPDGTPNTSAINTHSLFQTKDENGNLLFNPAANTQAGEAPVYSTQDQGAGKVMQQLAGQIKMNAPSPGLLQDPLFRNFGLSALAMAGGAALAPELGAAGAGAEAFPVTGGSLIPATELGAAGALPAAGAAGAAGAGSLTAAQALQYAKTGLSLAGLGSQLAGAGGGTSGGGGTSSGGTSGGGTSGGGTSGGGTVNANGPWNTPLVGQNISWAKQSATPTSGENPQLAMLMPSLDPSLARQLSMSGATGSNLGSNYFSYGSPAQTTQPTSYKDGGGVLQSFKDGGSPHIPEFITGATGHYVKGRGDGQSDDIPAMLADGEYVFDADTVAQLGNGSSDAGAKVLDKMREELRGHKRSAPVDKIPPKSKSPLEYIKQSMKRN